MPLDAHLHFDAYDSRHLSLFAAKSLSAFVHAQTTAFRLVNTLERAGFLIRMDNNGIVCRSDGEARWPRVRGTPSARSARPVMLQVNAQTSKPSPSTPSFASRSDRREDCWRVDTPAPLA